MIERNERDNCAAIEIIRNEFQNPITVVTNNGPGVYNKLVKPCIGRSASAFKWLPKRSCKTRAALICIGNLRRTVWTIIIE